MKTYVCTFGSDQILGGYYLRIIAKDESQARKFMYENFNNKWCGIYSSEEWEVLAVSLGSFAEKQFKEIDISYK